MGTNETIRGNVADVYVVNSDIADTAQITSAKFANSVGKWSSGSWVSGSQTMFTGTAAFTVLQIGLKVTAAAAGLVTVVDTAGAVLMTLSTTATFTAVNQAGAIALNAVIHVYTASNSTLTDIAAGNQLLITATNTTAGKWYMNWIETQT
jgi:hypothetical protein